MKKENEIKKDSKLEHEYKVVNGNENNQVDLKRENEKKNNDELKDKSKLEKEHRLQHKNQPKNQYKLKRKIHAKANLIVIMNHLSGKKKILLKIKQN